jgi:hypothetical protein
MHTHLIHPARSSAILTTPEAAEDAPREAARDFSTFMCGIATLSSSTISIVYGELSSTSVEGMLGTLEVKFRVLIAMAL